MDRAEKQEQVTELNGVFKGAAAVVVAHYSGLTVAQMSALRRQMKQQGAGVKVAKNRLAKRALEGTEVAHIAPLFKGPTVIAYSGAVNARQAAAELRAAAYIEKPEDLDCMIALVKQYCLD